MTNKNEELKNLLSALNEKLVHLASYESLLIKEADILKEMYAKVANSIISVSRMADRFEQYHIIFIKTLEGRVTELNHNILDSVEKLLNLVKEFLARGENND